MEKSRIICVLMALTAASGPTAKAVCVNPAEGHFSLVTYGSDDCWDSSTCVVPTYPEYNYEWELTHKTGPWPAIQVMGQWYDIWNDIDPSDKSGSGTLGPLPIVNELTLHIDYPEIKADFYTSINADGYAQICIKNVEFGLAEGYQVTGARFQGDVTITGVPEPATFILLSLGALGLVRRRQIGP
jgi:hypothetical protein